MRHTQYGIRNTHMHTLSAASNTFGIRYSCQLHVTGTCILGCNLRLYGFYTIVLAPSSVQGCRQRPEALPDHCQITFGRFSAPEKYAAYAYAESAVLLFLCIRKAKWSVCLITDCA
jgi:hypothetical protein